MECLLKMLAKLLAKLGKEPHLPSLSSHWCWETLLWSGGNIDYCSKLHLCKACGAHLAMPASLTVSAQAVHDCFHQAFAKRL